MTLQEDAVAGAVYSPLELIVPQFADQVTELFVLPVTVAVNCSVVFTLIEPDAGLMATTTVGGGPALTVTFAEAESAPFAMLVAVTVQEDAVEGAVYSPLELIVPQVVDHATEVFVLPVTVAANSSVVSTLIESVAGLTVTATVVGAPWFPALNAIANACIVDELTACVQLNGICEVLV